MISDILGLETNLLNLTTAKNLRMVKVSVSLRLIMRFEKFSGFVVKLKFLAVFIHLLQQALGYGNSRSYMLR
jgi:hypothetical protein